MWAWHRRSVSWYCGGLSRHVLKYWLHQLHLSPWQPWPSFSPHSIKMEHYALSSGAGCQMFDKTGQKWSFFVLKNKMIAVCLMRVLVAKMFYFWQTKCLKWVRIDREKNMQPAPTKKQQKTDKLHKKKDWILITGLRLVVKVSNFKLSAL